MLRAHSMHRARQDRAVAKRRTRGLRRGSAYRRDPRPETTPTQERAAERARSDGAATGRENRTRKVPAGSMESELDDEWQHAFDVGNAHRGGRIVVASPPLAQRLVQSSRHVFEKHPFVDSRSGLDDPQQLLMENPAGVEIVRHYLTAESFLCDVLPFRPALHLETRAVGQADIDGAVDDRARRRFFEPGHFAPEVAVAQEPQCPARALVEIEVSRQTVSSQKL